MNARKMGSAVGFGLMFVVVLSMIAMPVLAEEERGYRYHEVGTSGSGWYAYLCAQGVWDNNDPYVFTAGSIWSETFNGYVNYYDEVESATIIWAETIIIISGGIIIIIKCWISPDAYPNTHGGSWQIV
ncbi:MAG: hypothetical protein LBE76_05005 [Nitrososphaerota archaeon]|jgi:hypothetical protein|nr:hypothetical protein [Nitrososphaerota archaeon]